MINAPSPLDLGLKQESWRVNQWETIEAIASSEARVVILQAPPGTGKSLLALGLLRYLKSRGVILTSTKSLQNQYMEEANGTAETISGRNNYHCIMPDVDNRMAQSLDVRVGTTVDLAPCGFGFKCPYVPQCPYFIQRDIAAKSMISIHNYSYWLAETASGKLFKGNDWVIADEGHLLDNAVSSFKTVIITPYLQGKLRSLGIVETGDRSLLTTWQQYGMLGLAACTNKMNPLKEYTAEWKSWARIKQLCGDLSYVQGGLVFQQNSSVRIQPLWCPTVDEVLLGDNKGARLLIMSATILDPEMFNRVHGLSSNVHKSPNDVQYIDLPWTFHPDRRMIKYTPVAWVSGRSLNASASLLARAVDHIIEDVGGKGIIHTHSRALLEAVTPLIKYKNLYVHTREVNRADLIQGFKDDLKSSWIISPSIDVGEDFPYDVARTQIVLKVPFPGRDDPVVAQRYSEDKMWYNYVTMQDLWQTCGRVCRAEDDYGETVILDFNFGRVVEKYPQWVPQGIRESIEGL